MTEKKQGLELKRVVMVKAIVTEAFKQNLTRELDRAITNLESQATKIENQSKTYFDNLKEKGMMKSQLLSFAGRIC